MLSAALFPKITHNAYFNFYKVCQIPVHAMECSVGMLCQKYSQVDSRIVRCHSIYNELSIILQNTAYSCIFRAACHLSGNSLAFP